MFFYSAILYHFEASELLENNEEMKAYLYWFCCFTALAGSLRFQIASLIEKLINKKK